MNFSLQVFEPFGQVELVQLPLDPMTGLCKGYGFIQVGSSPEVLPLAHVSLSTQFLKTLLHHAVCTA